ncbi:MAG: ABC transporter permease [Clostridiales bacterium]|jgi:peptide/nickel transport system permease protein|nr:ABC transporter permease [Clostridiales bacterium]
MNNNKIDVTLKSKEYKKKSQFMETWQRLCKNKTAILGLIVFIIIIVMSVSAPLFLDYDTQIIKMNIPEKLQAPSAAHPFGTDEMGRDILARVIWGSQISLRIGFATIIFALFMGGIFGSIAGFFGGWIDNVIMRIMDIFLAIPGTLLAMCIVAALGASEMNLIIAMAISYMPTFSRVVRGPVLTVRGAEYVEAARAIGAKNSTIIMSHVLPNCMAPVIVQTSLSIGGIILSIAGLSFLGLGVQPPEPEWGALLSGARTYIRDQSYMAMFPGLAIMVTILSLNLLGDGLRDALDPRLK